MKLKIILLTILVLSLGCKMEFNHELFLSEEMPIKYKGLNFYFTLVPQTVNAVGSQSRGPWALKMIVRSELPKNLFSAEMITKERDDAGREIEVVESGHLTYQQLRIKSAMVIDSEGNKYVVVKKTEQYEGSFKSVKSLVSNKWMNPEVLHVFANLISLDFHTEEKLELILDMNVKINEKWESFSQSIEFKAFRSKGKKSFNPFFDIT